MADLSSRLRQRMAQHPPTDPISALKRRQAALKAYDEQRRQKLWLIAGGFGCMVAAGALAWGIVMFAAAGRPASDRAVGPVQTAHMEPAAPVQTASATPDQAPAPDAVAVEVTTVPAPDAQPVETRQAEARPADAQPPDAQTANTKPEPPPLPRRDIIAAQQLLAEFGFDPGPIDGTAGPRTLEAVSRYEESRGLPRTGALDAAMLQRLRQDPAPKVMVAQRPASPPPQPQPQYAQAEPPQRRTPAVFRPVEMAGRQITIWLSSVFR
ncbi:MAG TPA: peptidoglycan-binding protein [Reyranella sp.]|nr:peptidoglycan-binding protein [Reyranella sp.]